MFSEYAGEAESGDLRLVTSDAISARTAAEKWLTHLKEMHVESQRIPKSAGFFALRSAQELAGKFDMKVTDPASGLQTRLSQFIEAGEELSHLILTCIRRLEAEDDAAASNYLAMHGLSDKQPSELKTRYQQLNPIQQPR